MTNKITAPPTENEQINKINEIIDNLVTSISSQSTDSQYPSAKCVYDLIGDVETLLSQV